MNVKVPADKPTVGRILEAATKLFALKGLAAVSVKELAEAAGVNIALISYYFGGKENLYAVVLERQFAILNEVIDSLSKTELEPIAKLKECARLTSGGSEPCFYGERLFFGEIHAPTACYEAIVKPQVAKFHAFLRGCIEEAVAAGTVKPGIDPDYAALALANISRLHYAVRLLMKGVLPERDDQGEFYLSQAMDIYLHGILNT